MVILALIGIKKKKKMEKQDLGPLQIPDSWQMKIPAWPVPARRGHWHLIALGGTRTPYTITGGTE